MIELHSNRTPNSQKIVIFLEEAISLPYKIVFYDILKGEHLTPAFRAINPNMKLPAIVDYGVPDGEQPFGVFESGAILQYLAERTGKFLPATGRERSVCIQWLTWQVAGLGPMHGQAGHFIRYAPEGQTYGVNRYSKEARRLLAVMENRLCQSRYLAHEFSIADMAAWPWVNVTHAINIDLMEFPSVHRWWRELSERSGFQRVICGDESIPKHLMKGRMELTEEQWSNAFGQRNWAAVNL